MRLKAALTISLAVFIVSACFGALTPPQMKEAFVFSIIKNFSPLNESVKEMLSQGKGLQVFSALYITIFYNNLKVALLNYVLGFSMVVPLSILGFNGYVVGAFLTYGNTAGNAVLLLPHGVFELSAIILSAGLGLVMGWEII
ncbi:MAG: stage II sporulation protein M, partial [Desulfurococcales archaeon]|nr:stage II sporulation protein M [Desulfurococcales archaeon]